MKRLYLPLILFFIMIFEGVAQDLIPFMSSNTLIIPHWVFIFLVFITIFYDERDNYSAIYYAILFGLLIDVVFTGILGVYMFSYAIVIYIVHRLKVLVHANFYMTLILGIIGVSLTDLLIYIIYSVVGLTNMNWGDYLFYRLLPTVLANAIFLIIFYPVIKKRLLRWGREISSRNDLI